MNILVAIDLSTATADILAACAKVAQSTQARTWLLHVAEPDPEFVGFDTGPDVVREQMAEEYREQHRCLQKHADGLREDGLDVTALQVQGPTVATILHQAEKLQADLIITGSHGKGALMDVLVGSVSKGVLRKALCPVLIVPTRGRS